MPSSISPDTSPVAALLSFGTLRQDILEEKQSNKNIFSSQEISISSTSGLSEDHAYDLPRPIQKKIAQQEINNNKLTSTSKILHEIRQQISDFLKNINKSKADISDLAASAIQDMQTYSEENNIPKSQYYPQTSSTPENEASVFSSPTLTEIETLIENAVLNGIPLFKGSLKRKISLNFEALMSLIPSKASEKIQKKTPSSPSKAFSSVTASSKKVEISITALPNSPITKDNMEDKKLFFLPLTNQDNLNSIQTTASFSDTIISLAMLMAEINAATNMLTNFVAYQQNPFTASEGGGNIPDADDLLHALKHLSRQAQKRLNDKILSICNGESQKVQNLFRETAL